MSEESLKKLNENLVQHMKDAGIKSAFYYEPFTDKGDSYWLQKKKFAFCNLEPYYNPKDIPAGINRVSEDLFLNHWIYTKTCGNTAKLNYFLLKSVGGEEGFDTVTKDMVRKFSADLRNKSKQETLIMEFDEYTCCSAYFNFRLTVNQTGSANQDKNGIFSFYRDEYYKKYYIDYLKALETDVLIVSGRVSCNLINQIYSDPKSNFNLNLEYDGESSKLGKLTVFSIRHPSRIGYQYIADKVNFIKSKC